jgi:hypothetical protein
MAQGQLTELASLSIENDKASVLDYTEILGSFSSRESRDGVSENFIYTY